MYELTMPSAAAMAQTQDATTTTVEELVREHGRLVFRVPIQVGGDKGVQYMDVGLKIDANFHKRR